MEGSAVEQMEVEEKEITFHELGLDARLEVGECRVLCGRSVSRLVDSDR